MKRSQLLILAALLAGCTTPGTMASAPDLSGSWSLVEPSGVSTLTLRQTGGEVSGTYAPTIAAFKLAGRVVGRHMDATISFEPMGQPMAIAADLDGDRLTGRFGNGETFTGSRVK